MLSFLSRALASAAVLALVPLASAQGLNVLGAPKNVKEIDLYDTKQGGQYLKSIDVQTLSFPIPVVEERALGFVIKLNGGQYYVGASDVVTDKAYATTALCDSQLAGPTGASRGIAGKGCK